MLLGSYDGNLTALLSAHQSIGVPQPLIMFGTEAQKKKFLPRVARGEISAFALTEQGVGSDPATMTTRADPTADGKYFVLNGEKLWCTNGVKAGVIVVMAKTPPRLVNGKEKSQVTAFIVDPFGRIRVRFKQVFRFKPGGLDKEMIAAIEEHFRINGSG